MKTDREFCEDCMNYDEYILEVKEDLEFILSSIRETQPLLYQRFIKKHLDLKHNIENKGQDKVYNTLPKYENLNTNKVLTMTKPM